MLLLGLAGCAASPKNTASAPAPEWFTDVAQAAGLDFVHFNGMSGEFYYPEIMAPGVGAVRLRQRRRPRRLRRAGAAARAPADVAPPTPRRRPLDGRLFRNDLVVNADGTRTLHFTDVTDAERHRRCGRTAWASRPATSTTTAGSTSTCTGLRAAVLLHNNGDGTFTDVTKAAGVGDPGGWGVSAAFFDYDRDGWLDLFVGNYLIYSLAGDVQCLSVTGRRDYCPPNSYRAQPSRLYHNRGNGTFEDVTAKALVSGAYGPALGVADRRLQRRRLDRPLRRQRRRSRTSSGSTSTTARSRTRRSWPARRSAATGQAEASMGVDAGDFDNDGDEDLFITNWLDQMNVAVRQRRRGQLRGSARGRPASARRAWRKPVSAPAGSISITTAGSICSPPTAASRPSKRWRARTIRSRCKMTHAAVPQPRHRPLRGRLEPRRRGLQARGCRSRRRVRRHRQRRRHRRHRRQHQRETARAREWRAEPQPLARVAARGQVQRRGRLQPANRPPEGGPTTVVRDMLGARVEIVRADAPTLWRRARADGSYASANDPRVLVGLGASAEPPG